MKTKTQRAWDELRERVENLAGDVEHSLAEAYRYNSPYVSVDIDVSVSKVVGALYALSRRWPGYSAADARNYILTMIAAEIDMAEESLRAGV